MTISLPALLSQLLLGLVNGSFYAILSLGLAVIFGLLNVINFAHGALFMLGAVLTWMAMEYFGINYWVMLIAAPIVIGLFGVVMASINIFGGFAVTERMLAMYKKKEKK